MARAKTAPAGFKWVVPTAEELQAYRDSHYGNFPHYAVRRMVCRACGTRIWGAGIAIGSHRRNCGGPPVQSSDQERNELVEKIIDAQIAVDTANDVARRAESTLADLQRLLAELNA